jgi:spore germination protein GerM
MKKIFILGLNVFIILMLAACGVGKPESSSVDVRDASQTEKIENVKETDTPDSADLDEHRYSLAGEKRVLTLYFGNDNADKVVAEQREVEIIEGEDIEKLVFEELSNGPKKEGSQPIIPKETKLLSVTTENGLCTLNLSREFIDNHPGGTAGELMTLSSIVNSLTELPDIKNVQFLIEGQKQEVYLHVVFDEPFSRYEEMIQK